MRKLRKHLKLAQVREMFGESIDVTYGLPMRYDRCWSASRDASGSTSEGQSIVMVCFDGESVVGYAGLGAFVMRDRGDPKVTLSLAPELVYVVPSRRGQGFGMDLSVACGIVAQELLRAVYNAVPARTDLVATVIADYESEGGESFTLHLKTCLECEVDMLREGGSRRTVTLGRVELDAGY